jgi:hypothetical protein
MLATPPVAYAGSGECETTTTAYERVEFELVSGPGDPAMQGALWAQFAEINEDDLQLHVSSAPEEGIAIYIDLIEVR